MGVIFPDITDGVGFTLGAGGLLGQLYNFSETMGVIFLDITGGSRLHPWGRWTTGTTL